MAALQQPSQQRISKILGHLRANAVSSDGTKQKLKYVLITGCSRGIGLGLVDALLSSKADKYYVIATCRSPHKQHKLRNLISKYPRNASLIALDISNEESIIQSMSKILAVTSHIDVLINNAGISSSNHPYESVLDFEATETLRIFKTNVIGTALMVKHYIDLLKSAPDGEATKVINMSSELGSLSKAFDGYQKGNTQRMTTTSYRLSKCSINMLTRLQAGELSERYNIIFTCLNPGWIQTDLGGTHDRTPPLTVEQSVRGIVHVMEAMNMSTHNAMFVDYKGQQLPW